MLMEQEPGGTKVKLFVHNDWVWDFDRVYDLHKGNANKPAIQILKGKLAVTDPFYKAKEAKYNGFLYTVFFSNPAILSSFIIDLQLGEAIQITKIENDKPLFISGPRLLEAYRPHIMRTDRKETTDFKYWNHAYFEIYGSPLFEASVVDQGFLNIVRLSPNVKSFKEILTRHCIHVKLGQSLLKGIGAQNFETLQNAVKDLSERDGIVAY